jgi:hypothetical protein
MIIIIIMREMKPTNYCRQMLDTSCFASGKSTYREFDDVGMGWMRGGRDKSYYGSRLIGAWGSYTPVRGPGMFKCMLKASLGRDGGLAGGIWALMGTRVYRIECRFWTAGAQTQVAASGTIISISILRIPRQPRLLHHFAIRNVRLSDVSTILIPPSTPPATHEVEAHAKCAQAV